MSMTKEEAKKHIVTWFYSLEDYELPPLQVTQALQVAISALLPITKEQVEKMRGEWEWFDEEVRAPFEYQEREWGWRCSKCGAVQPDDFDNPDYTPTMRFCENCGAPMTDEAVDMMMERLEEIYGKTD